MTLTGVDIAWARPTVAQIQAVGAHFVARYLSNDPKKNITSSEVAAYRAAGIASVVVWETTTGRATAGRAAGVADAQAAEAERRAVGLPDDMVLHFAVDEDTGWSSVAPYFAGAASVIGQQRVGVYGGYRVIEGAAAAGYRYLWQTVAWSDGLWSAHATIRQTGGTTLAGGADWDTAETPDFGQYPRPTPPPEPDMPLTDTDVAKVALAVNAYRNAKDDQVSVAAGHGHIPDVYGRAVTTSETVARIETALAKSAPVALTDAQVQQIAAALAANPAFIQALSAGIGKDIAARMQS